MNKTARRVAVAMAEQMLKRIFSGIKILSLNERIPLFAEDFHGGTASRARDSNFAGGKRPVRAVTKTIVRNIVVSEMCLNAFLLFPMKILIECRREDELVYSSPLASIPAAIDSYYHNLRLLFLFLDSLRMHHHACQGRRLDGLGHCAQTEIKEDFGGIPS